MLRQLFHQILNPIYKVHQLVSGNIKFRSRCSSNSSCCSSFVIFTIENRALHNINQDSCLILISAVRIRILCRGNNKTSIIKELQSNREYDLSVKSISKCVKIECRYHGACWALQPISTLTFATERIGNQEFLDRIRQPLYELLKHAGHKLALLIWLDCLVHCLSHH